MSHRVNILLQDENWETFQSIPKGKRSTVMNVALRDWSLRQQRGTAFKEIAKITKTMKILPGSAADWIRSDRDQH
jgi:hypothetical protein